MKRITTLVLAMLLLLSACSTSDKPEETPAVETEGTETEISGTEEEDDGRRSAQDTVPELDFEGADVTILCGTGFEYEYFAEDIKGETINDAIYNRKLYTEDRLKVTFSMQDMSLEWGAHTAFVTSVNNSVSANDGAYDIISCSGYTTPLMVIRGLMSDLNPVEHLNFQQPWWHADFEKAATVNGKLYMHTGDIVLTSASTRYAIFFNQELLNSYLPDFNPYEVVLDGAWTTDYVMGMLEGTYNDLNFDGIRGPEDFYAFKVAYGQDAWFVGNGGTIMGRDEDGNPVFDIYNEHNINIIEKYLQFSTSEKSYLKNDANDMFAKRRAIFSFEQLGASETLRDFEDSYGILPFPKWDEAQKDYYSIAGDNHSEVMIPIDCKAMDMAGAVMEVMAAESYRSVTPAYFEVVMKNKYFRDEESAQMFDIILAGAKYDFGIIYTSSIGDPVFIVRNSMTGGGFASRYNSEIGKMQAYLKNTMKKFADLD